MNFHDDSHILSKLGILASRDESPHKIRSSSSSKAKASSEKDRFVDVSIDGLTELKSESDEEEPIFDRLFDPSVAGLTKGCRLRLATVQTIASFLESLVGLAAILLSSQRNTYYMNILHHVVVVISRSFVIISGQCAYSVLGCCLALMCSSLGSLLLLYPSADPFASFVLLSMGTGVFGLVVFLHVEVRVHPRSGTQLDYYIFPSLVGRFLSVVLFTFLLPGSVSQIMSAVLVSSALLIMAFIFLARSVGKAARLKEIMEYSSFPVLDACGEYVSLMEDDVGLESAEDDRDEATPDAGLQREVAEQCIAIQVLPEMPAHS
ncbi:unnamed protein product [Angiostrongylus costaricensis]|uniref:Transmembrane protein n=1 Tax=Angiostrongylus costaricensis TaxID=334426 RepID=A0A0R3PJ13_ANGCS|nr:unnamed protein product [Angiostrongylus costaricensis]